MSNYVNDIESNFEKYEEHIAIDIEPEPEYEPEPKPEYKPNPEPKRDYVLINIRPININIVQPINIQIKTATGKLFVVNINPHETILYLKKQIYISQDVSLDNQRLIFGGKQLEDHKRINEYDINDGTMIHIVLRLRGGMFHKSSARADWISLNYLDKMERGLSMLDYLKREASDKLFTIFEDFEEMLKTAQDDFEIDMIYELIRNIYIE